MNKSHVLATLAIALLLLSGCAGRRPKTRSMSPEDSTAVTDTSWAPQETPRIDPVHMPPPEWTGQTFILLPKNEMFRKFGYELYGTADLGNALAPADTSAFLLNGRLRADLYGGAELFVRAVSSFGDDYLVRFFIRDRSLEVFGRTRQDAIEGLVLREDLRRARNRWSGDTIYSVRRQIDLFDSSKARFSSIPVSLSEPLAVDSIAIGQSPLPPKPIWVFVSRESGGKGFIPVHFGWTNVIKSEQYDADHPWKEDILEGNPRELFAWDEYYWQAIDQHKVLTGMSPDQVRLSWGPPEKRRQKDKSDGTSIKHWEYESATLIFVNDSLTAE